MMRRDKFLKEAAETVFDICIIGGGITGAGVLCHAIERGMKAILIEKHDFASGTSSRSSKMIHGGLRYLKMAQFGMVREALHEREHLLRICPEHVQPLPFIMPIYHSALFLNLMALVVWFYTRLAGRSVLKKSRKLSKEKVKEYIPGIRSKWLKGGILYWDGSVNDALLTLHFLQQSVIKGAVALNYFEARAFMISKNKVQIAKCVDMVDRQQHSVKARVFINATGVWTDDLLNRAFGDGLPVMKPSKGIHVLVPQARIPSNYVALVSSGTTDHRYLYAFPWNYGLTVLGTTDTEYSENPDDAMANESDVDYLLKSFNINFPSTCLTKNDIVSVFSGLRPMLNDQHNKGSYFRSREYHIWWSNENFLNIAGGKLTSFYSMGKKCMDVACTRLNHHTSVLSNEQITETGSEKVIREIIKEDHKLGKIISNDFDIRGADVAYYIRYLFALNVQDILTRRTTITYAMKDFNEALVREVATIMAAELNRDQPWVDFQVEDYHKHWNEYHPDFLTK